MKDNMNQEVEILQRTDNSVKHGWRLKRQRNQTRLSALYLVSPLERWKLKTNQGNQDSRWSSGSIDTSVVSATGYVLTLQ